MSGIGQPAVDIIIVMENLFEIGLWVILRNSVMETTKLGVFGWLET
jgi:hypothetical protein